MLNTLAAYLELTKPKVTLLNLLVASTCFVLAAFPTVDLAKLLVFLAAGYLACGGCGAINCVYDQDMDRLMLRTSKRAIPAGSVSPSGALVFGVALTGAGLALSYLFFNTLTTLMMTLGAAFYLLIYTVLLKRTSSWNVVIGGFAGCFAALSGWTAAANAVSLTPLMVSLVDFLWTPGHLWGLAMKKVAEYKKAGVPMLPVKFGLRKAAALAFLFNIAAVACSLGMIAVGLTGLTYCVFAVGAGAWFIFESMRLLSLPSEASGFRVFLVSMPYLAVLMAGLIVDKVFQIL